MSSQFPDRPARPWDLFNKNIGRVETEIAEKRFAICKECPAYVKLTHQCKECGCVMNAKTKLPNASCPLNKWGQVISNISQGIIDDGLTPKGPELPLSGKDLTIGNTPNIEPELPPLPEPKEI